jgi:hypothetical protein
MRIYIGYLLEVELPHHHQWSILATRILDPLNIKRILHITHLCPLNGNINPCITACNISIASCCRCKSLSTLQKPYIGLLNKTKHYQNAS